MRQHAGAEFSQHTDERLAVHTKRQHLWRHVQIGRGYGRLVGLRMRSQLPSAVFKRGGVDPTPPD